MRKKFKKINAIWSRTCPVWSCSFRFGEKRKLQDFFFGSSITNLTQEEQLTLDMKHSRRGAVVSVTSTFLHFWSAGRSSYRFFKTLYAFFFVQFHIYEKHIFLLLLWLRCNVETMHESFSARKFNRSFSASNIFAADIFLFIFFLIDVLRSYFCAWNTVFASQSSRQI